MPYLPEDPDQTPPASPGSALHYLYRRLWVAEAEARALRLRSGARCAVAAAVAFAAGVATALGAVSW